MRTRLPLLRTEPSSAQFAPDPLYIDVLALVGEGRIAGDYEQPANAREGGDDLLDHAVGEIFLFRVTAEIVERQHRERRLLRARFGGGFSGGRRFRCTEQPVAPPALATHCNSAASCRGYASAVPASLSRCRSRCCG